jgi:hypothetical protein
VIALLEKLKKGSPDAAPMYKNCVEAWVEIFPPGTQPSEKEIAQKLATFQMRIESICGMDRYTGKSVMPYTGLSFLYDDQKGFGDNRKLAIRLLRAFQKSYVSVEVKSWAEDAAVVFNLDDELDEEV